MKYFFFLFLLFPALVIGQDYTLPDSIAIIKNHVKTASVYYYYDSTNMERCGNYHYNKNGQCIYFRSGSSPHHYTYEYYENGKLKSINKKDSLEKTVFRFEYSPSGYISKSYDFKADDTGIPDEIHYFDSLGNEFRNDFLYNGIASHIILDQYNEQKTIIHRIDSFPMQLTCEYKGKDMIRQTFYDSSNAITESRTIFYNANGKLSQVNCSFGNKTEIFKTEYDNNGKPKTTLNGKPMSKEAAEKWNREFSNLVQDRDPYPVRPPVDPWNAPEFIHKITIDKNGNIIRDFVSPALRWQNDDLQLVDYRYTYEYW
jgi:antitoxin component YwqK of YwqJK toxin-antitoxin module